MRLAVLSVSVAALALAGCRTAVHEQPVGVDQAKPIVLEARRLWRLVDGGQVLGVVVRFETADGAQDPTRHYYSVRNALQQELGTIDGHGRAWRFEPHEREPRFVGTGKLLDGVRQILGVAGRGELVEAPLARRNTGG